MLKDYDLTIDTYDTGGTKMDFMHSCERLNDYAKSCDPSIGYFWLEDDWLINSDKMLASDIKKLFKNNLCHISLANRNELSFNPGIWSKDLFEHVIYNNLSNAYKQKGYGTQAVLNPERICTYPVDKTRAMVRHYCKLDRYHDVGRTWQKNNLKGIQTWKLV